MSLCAACHGGCCRSLLLLITAYDALRIAEDLELPPETVARFVAIGDSQIAPLRETHALIRFADNNGPLQHHLLTLAKVQSQLLPGTEKCKFLLEWPRPNPATGESHPGARITGRCGIYGSRPLMCRTYPALLDPQRGPVVGHRASMREATGDQALCPEPWDAAMFGPDPGRTVHDLVLERYEFDFFRAAVARWNAEARPKAGFFPFMREIYRDRLKTAEETYAAPEANIKPLSLADIFPQYRAIYRSAKDPTAS